MHRARGVTLVELMIVIAIAAILLGLAVPNMQEFYVSNRLGSAANDFMAALSTARNEAMRRGVPVTMRSKAGSQNWTDGWTLCVDANAFTNPTGPAGTCLAGATNTIRNGPPLTSPLTLYADATLGSYVTFDTNGRSLRSDSTNAGGTFVICHGSALTSGSKLRSRAAAVNSVGRIRAAVDTNNDGIPNKDSGANVASCTNP